MAWSAIGAAVAAVSAIALGKFAWDEKQRNANQHAQHHIGRAQVLMTKAGHTTEEIDAEINAAFDKGDLSDSLEAITDAARHYSSCGECDPHAEHARHWIKRSQKYMDGALATIKHRQNLLDIAKQNARLSQNEK
jgi:hypothetical protein